MPLTLNNRRAAPRSGRPHPRYLSALLVLAMAALTCRPAIAEPDVSREYKIKAAFLYKFLLFVERPRERHTDKILIAIVGKDPFETAFDAVEGKPIGAGKAVLEVRRYASVEDMLDSSASECDLAFVDIAGGQDELGTALRQLADKGVLTVGDAEGFLEAGGMIGFVMRDNKVRWEINQAAVRRARLQMSSQLLRNAVRVIAKEQD